VPISTLRVAAALASRRIDAEVEEAGGVRSSGDRDRDPPAAAATLAADDLGELTRLLTDPEVIRYIVLNEPFTPEDLADVSARTVEQWEHNDFGPWVAIEKATGRWIGRIGLSEIPDWPGSDKIEVGWELHQEFWGRGLATEGGRAAVRYGFEVVGLARIMSGHHGRQCGLTAGDGQVRPAVPGRAAPARTVMVWYTIARVDWRAGQPVAGP
jgi:RimJ/RimL family protein N-acetyltransferase